MPTLDWIGKKAVLNHHNEVPFHLLRCNPDLSVGEANGNMLVQGDNLLALKALLPYYSGQVKCIYIDPPYNTGNENWVYNDNVNSPEMREWLGKIVGGEAEDLSRHDKWLCMMYPRLILLQEFLSDDGVIFVSIDDTEVCNLRLLMNEIFNPGNWICTLIWKRRQTPDSRNLNGVSTDHEYVLCYGKSSKVRFKGQAKDLSKYSNPDNDPNGPWMSDNLTGLANAIERPNLHYDMVNPITGDKYPPHPSRGWIFGKERMSELINQDKILWPKNSSGRPRLKRYISDMKSDTTGFSTILDAPGNVVGTKELASILGPKIFAFPKPSELIRILIDQVTDKSSIVLDSFAGSGTTGQAVIDLNHSDGGSRRFILIEMEENIAKTITKKRLENSMVTINELEVDASFSKNGLRFCELGPTLFNAKGQIRSEVTFTDLARHVFFTETGQALPSIHEENALLGKCNEIAVYLLYNGVMRDAGNVLTPQTLAQLPPYDGQKVIYADGCKIGRERLREMNITFKQIPYEIKVR